MRARCFQKNNPDYPNYGGRGITISNEWDTSNKFVLWAYANGYDDNLTIDRIDVNGNYEPNNCRWITIQEQQRNRRSNKFITWQGETKTCSEWDEYFGYNPGTIAQRLRRGWDIEKIITHKIDEIAYNYNQERIHKVKITFPNFKEEIFPSLAKASEETKISIPTLSSLATEEGRKKSRKYKNYIIEIL